MDFLDLSICVCSRILFLSNALTERSNRRNFFDRLSMIHRARRRDRSTLAILGSDLSSAFEDRVNSSDDKLLVEYRKSRMTSGVFSSCTKRFVTSADVNGFGGLIFLISIGTSLKKR